MLLNIHIDVVVRRFIYFLFLKNVAQGRYFHVMI